jgi:hypothetical protein
VTRGLGALSGLPARLLVTAIGALAPRVLAAAPMTGLGFFGILV